MTGDNRPTAESQISAFLFAAVLIDEDMRLAEVNHAAEVMLGQSARRLIGTRLFDVVDLQVGGLAERLSRDGGPLVARGLSISLGGYDRQINFTASPITANPGWRVLTLSDAGKDSMRSDGDIPRALKAPAILAHEIKNPLSAIRGAAQLIARKLGEDDTRLTSMIAEEVDRIARLVDRMQELGSSTMEPVEAINLHQAIRSALATVRTVADGKVELAEEFDPSLPPVAASRDALVQVLINLISNAVDACSSVKEPRILVRTRFVSGLAANIRRAGPPVRLPIEVTVSDNGPGFDPDLKDHIFEPFVSSKKNGQGLGLALVNKLVGDMGGRISHDRDDTEQLTKFRIHLAVARQER